MDTFDIFKQKAQAYRRQKSLKKGETCFLGLTDALTDWLMENSDLFATKDLHAVCARLEGVFTGIERMFQNADGIWDAEDIVQSRDDLAEFRKDLEALI